MTEQLASFKQGERTTKIGFLAVSLIGIVKGLIGLLSGSISLQA